MERPEGASLRLVLLRHGEPEESAKGRCYGKLDVGLSREGRAHMERLATRLEGAGLEAVYASPRRRALESARLVAEAAGRPVVVEPRFSEIDFGVLEGLTYDEARDRFPELYESWMQRPTEVKFPGGESFDEMRERVLGAAHELREHHEDASVLVVAHGGVNRILLAEALGIASGAIFRVGQSYGGLNVVDYFGETPVVSLVNGTC